MQRFNDDKISTNQQKLSGYLGGNQLSFIHSLTVIIPQGKICNAVVKDV